MFMRNFSLVFLALAFTGSVFAADYQCSLQSTPWYKDQVVMLLNAGDAVSNGHFISSQTVISNTRVKYPNPDAISKVDTSLVMRKNGSVIQVFVVNQTYLKNPPTNMLMPMIKVIQQLSFEDGDQLNLNLDLIDGAKFEKTLPEDGLRLNCKKL